MHQEKNKKCQNPNNFLEETVISEGHPCCRHDTHLSSLQFISECKVTIIPISPFIPDLGPGLEYY